MVTVDLQVDLTVDSNQDDPGDIRGDCNYFYMGTSPGADDLYSLTDSIDLEPDPFSRESVTIVDTTVDIGELSDLYFEAEAQCDARLSGMDGWTRVEVFFNGEEIFEAFADFEGDAPSSTILNVANSYNYHYAHPPTITVEDVTDTSVGISWTSNVVDTSYDTEYRYSYETDWTTESQFDDTVTSDTFSALSTGGTYDFSVVATTKDNTNRGLVEDVFVHKLNPPTNVTGTTPVERELDISWTDTNEPEDLFVPVDQTVDAEGIIEYPTAVSPTVTVDYSLNGGSASLTITGSPAGTSEVQNITLDGSTSFSPNWSSTHTKFDVEVTTSGGATVSTVTLTGETNYTRSWYSQTDWDNSTSNNITTADGSFALTEFSLAVYGDGSDGSITETSNITRSSETLQTTNYTVDSGTTVDVDGTFIVHAQEFIEVNGTIDANSQEAGGAGGNSSSGTGEPGENGPDGIYVGGTGTGGAGGNGDAEDGNFASGGGGGGQGAFGGGQAGGDGGDGTGTTGTIPVTGGSVNREIYLENDADWDEFYAHPSDPAGGGAGGGAGGEAESGNFGEDGGDGGRGGGLVILIAPEIRGTGVIDAGGEPGEDGTDSTGSSGNESGGGGGGGGGSGGLIYAVYGDSLSTNLTTIVSGGAGGIGGINTSNGHPGGDGADGEDGNMYEISVVE